VDLKHWLSRAADAITEWQAAFGAYDAHPSVQISDDRFGAAAAG